MTRRRWHVLLGGVLAVVVAYPSVLAAWSAPRTDYEREIARLESEAADLRVRLARSEDQTSRLRLVFLVYRRASLTMDYSDLRQAEQTIDLAITQCGPLEDLVFLAASLQLKLHRNDRARAILSSQGAVAAPNRVVAAFGDIALQAGLYDEASALYGRAGGEDGNPTWDVMARQAYLVAHTEDAQKADAIYARAAEELTAKEMRSYAWIEVQRGVLCLEARSPADALAHFERARRAYSGWWLVEEHLAEALALLGRADEAIAVYEDVVAKCPHPEFLGALADLLASRDATRAADLARRAEAGFAAQRAIYPEAAVGHYLEYVAHRGSDPEQLLVLAEENHRIRPNADAKARLGLACIGMGQKERARELLRCIHGMRWCSPVVEELTEALSERRG